MLEEVQGHKNEITNCAPNVQLHVQIVDMAGPSLKVG